MEDKPQAESMSNQLYICRGHEPPKYTKNSPRLQNVLVIAKTLTTQINATLVVHWSI